MMTDFRDAARETPESGRGTVTIADVANAAGVSPSTVSYVITGNRTISPQTRRRVEESIRALGYQRRGGSPTTPVSRVGVLAMAIPLHGDRQLGIEMEFFSAAAATARDLGFDLLLITQDEGTLGLHRVMSAALADAAIIMNVEDDDPRVPVLLASGRPAVLIGVPSRDHGLTCVDLDFAAAGNESVTHLADLGHRSIALIGPPPELTRNRYWAGSLEGFTTTAARRRVNALSQQCGPSPEAVTHCLDKLLTHGGPTGLVVHDEAALPLVLDAVARRGLRVPEDVSVVALCSDTVARQQRMRATVVVIPVRKLGALAVERAVRQLGGDPASEPQLLAPRLIPGNSTATAPAA